MPRLVTAVNPGSMTGRLRFCHHVTSLKSFGWQGFVFLKFHLFDVNWHDLCHLWYLCVSWWFVCSFSCFAQICEPSDVPPWWIQLPAPATLKRDCSIKSSLMQFGKKNQDPHSISFKFEWQTHVKNCTTVISSLGQVAHMCHISPLFNSICDADIEATKCPWSYLSFKLRVQTLHCITKLVPMAMMALPTVVTKTVMMVLLLMAKRLNLSYGERC